MGLEPTRAEHIGLAVEHLSHSAKWSNDVNLVDQAPVVRRLDSAIHQIKHCTVDKC